MGAKANILVVEDERIIRRHLVSLLTEHQYQVISTESGKEAISIAAARKPDLLLLDLGLTDLDGMMVLKSIRCWSNVPVVVVSARQEEREKVEALDAGANDYMTKPFGAGELMARIRTAMRQCTKKTTNYYQIGGLCIDNNNMRVMLEGQEVYLTRIEYKILLLFARNIGSVLTYDFIIQEIWGDSGGDIQTLRVNMGNIRRKIEVNPADPVYLITEIGVGYRLASGI